MRWVLLFVLCGACDCAKSHELDGSTSRDARVDVPRADVPVADVPIVDTATDCPPAVLVRRCGAPIEPCQTSCICGTRFLLESCDIDELGSCVRDVEFCDVLERRSWESVDELECGLGPMGVELCPWRITFFRGRFEWSYSDVGESGTYECAGERVTSERAVGFWDASTQTLVWDGVAYRALPEACPD